MARVEKTVFISYRRRDVSWALAVYQYLTANKYDVFFDYTSIPSGDFEQSIISNIKARAHFILILTPTALERCNEPGDWLRREIETALREKRNIIPLFFDGFNFGTPSISKNLTGKLGTIRKYNGLDVPAGYFDAAMNRLRTTYLNVTLDAVLHPVSGEVQKVIDEQKIAADQAIALRKEAEEKAKKEKEAREEKEAMERARIDAEQKAKKETQEKARKEEEKRERIAAVENFKKKVEKSLSGILIAGKKFIQNINLKQLGIGGFAIMVLVGLIFGGNYIFTNLPASVEPTQTRQAIILTNTDLVTSTPELPQATLTSSSTFTPKPSTSISIPKLPTATSTPKFPIGSTMISPKDSMTIVYVPAGDFEMGSENGKDDEKPIHTVYLDAFWIDQTEITNAMYTKCVQAGNCNPPSSTGSYTRDFYYGNSEFDNYPVIYISWKNANWYCEWANRRLPTEAEWEKAARGTDGRTYPWGEEIDYTYANYQEDFSGDAIGGIAPVGSYEKGKSPYGVFDMAGNVIEWVADWYDENYYTNSPSSNPTGPENGESRVVRGGGWSIGDYNYTFGDVYTYNRGARDPSDNTYYSGMGFRCAMDAE